MSGHVMQTYARLPVTFCKGEGVWLEDDQGRKYLDALSGIGVCSLGHAHPEIIETICQQAKKLLHTSNISHIETQEKLADFLARTSGLDRVFFANSGGEANEAAFKLARLYGHSKGIEKPAIVVMSQAFHGRTLACLTATDSAKVQAGFGPLVEGFVRVEFNNRQALTETLESNPNIVAVMLEPVQGEGGVAAADEGFLSFVRQQCDQHDCLMIVDEIQTGMAKTGRWFAFQHEDVLPDIMTLAKALGSGVPIGACLARENVAELMKPGSHGSTFGGNPLACATALTTMQVMERDRLVEKAESMGAYLRDALHKRLSGLPALLEMRGKGMMIGLAFDRPLAGLVNIALEKGLVMNVTRDTVIRLLPPLVMSKTEADELVVRLADAIETFFAE